MLTVSINSIKNLFIKVIEIHDFVYIIKLKAENQRLFKGKKMLKLRHQVVRRIVCQRAVEWDSLASKLTDPRARAALDSLRNLHSEIKAEAREYIKEPEAIDFNHYRSVIKNKELVDIMEVCIYFSFSPSQT
jgi:hypothetical protein